MAEGRTTLGTAKRADIYYEAQKNAVEEAPWVLLSHSMDMAAYRPNIKEFALHPVGIVSTGWILSAKISSTRGKVVSREYNDCSASASYISYFRGR